MGTVPTFAGSELFKKGQTIDNVVAKGQLIVNKAWFVSRSLHAINQKGVFSSLGEMSPL